MLKFKKVYICDYCDAVEAPRKVCSMGHSWTDMPRGWSNPRKKTHLCEKCTDAWKALEGLAYEMADITNSF